MDLTVPIVAPHVKDQLLATGSAVVEASDLGFPIVAWPSSFCIAGIEERFNYWMTLRNDEGTMEAFRYRGVKTGNRITVFND